VFLSKNLFEPGCLPFRCFLVHELGVIVIAAGGCELKTRGKKYQLFAPKVVRDPTRRPFPFTGRLVLTIVGADEYMELSI
jgi:hypothetical protein